MIRKKYRKGKVWIILFLLLLLFIWSRAIQLSADIQENYHSVSVRIEGEGITEEQINQALESKEEKDGSPIPQVTLWNEKKKESIQNLMLNRTKQVELIRVSGNMEHTAPIQLLFGAYPSRLDKKGCVIDSESAYTLYGSYNVIGSEVHYKEEDYIIRGVVKAQKPVFLIQETAPLVSFQNMEFIYSDIEWEEKYTKDFLNWNWWNKSYTLVEGPFYGKVLNALVKLPVWLIGFFFLVWWIKKTDKKSFFLAIPVIYLFYLTVGSPFYFPLKWIPSKWSNLEYWTTLYKELLDQLQKIRFLTPLTKDVYLMDSAKNCLFYIIIVCIGLLGVFLTILCVSSDTKKKAETLIEEELEGNEVSSEIVES